LFRSKLHILVTLPTHLSTRGMVKIDQNRKNGEREIINFRFKKSDYGPRRKKSNNGIIKKTYY
jgi:hypothetical protein